MNVVQSDSAARPGISAWKPLRQPVFRALWIASLTSNVGTWMQNVGAACLMTSLTPFPVDRQTCEESDRSRNLGGGTTFCYRRERRDCGRSEVYRRSRAPRA